LIVNVPFIVELEPKFTPPARVTLLKPTVPVIVADPANATVPEPAVKVAEPFARVDPLPMVSVPPLDITTEPPFVNVPLTVIAPDAPKVIPDEVLMFKFPKVVLVAAELRVIL
jgi:hypothetical protein